ncbi:hypothetical protein QR680_015163 [Steinernema hermaphroditum]|uniref:Uncharacterized protein n=1 Tax=Steinernema hermaphroditum TaxID=289476 RepID=A0AA39M538_9BILA|nr:hypothetical protein QR680_015163 [Steinernema hermaphroditum]
MDAVPYNFIHDVAVLAEWQCFSQLQSPLWESVAQLYSSNCEYFTVSFRQTERGIEHIIWSYSDGCITPEYVRKNYRFVRVYRVVVDILHDDERREWANAAVLSEEKTKEMLETMLCARSQLSMQAEPQFLSAQRTLMSLLRDNLRFTTLRLAYHGEIAEEFLSYQIDHSKILKEVLLGESEWPNSVLTLIKKFCLQRRKNSVKACFSRTKIEGFDAVEFIEEFVDFWKQNGHLMCKFNYEVDEQTWSSLTEKEIDDYSCYTHALRHPTEKSIAYVWGGKVDGYVEFYRCVCSNNRPESRECRAKCYYPRMGINVTEERVGEEW